ncbi:MAG: hypothetical protein K2Q22_16640, partial [Cytophagales bacterium]|nr:hypothetical protein [Cytophagales bacterium]
TFTASSYAQMAGVSYNEKKFEKFKSGTTYVVKTGFPEFDKDFVTVTKDLWKISNYAFISSEEFKTKVKDNSSYFLVFTNFGLVLIQGGSSIDNYGVYDMLAFCPINDLVNEKYADDCKYRIRNMIESMLKTLDIIEQNKMKGNMISALLKKYNENSPSIKNRTLLFCLENMGPYVTENDIKDYYPYKYEIVTKEKLAQIIKEKNPKYYYYHLMLSSSFKYICVFDPTNGETLYGTYTMTAYTPISVNNLKDLTKKIEGN